MIKATDSAQLILLNYKIKLYSYLSYVGGIASLVVGITHIASKASFPIIAFTLFTGVFLLALGLIAPKLKSPENLFLFTILGCIVLNHFLSVSSGGIYSTSLWGFSAILVCSFFLLDFIKSILILFLGIADVAYFYFNTNLSPYGFYAQEFASTNIAVSLVVIYVLSAVIILQFEKGKKYLVEEIKNLNRALVDTSGSLKKILHAVEHTDNAIIITDAKGRIEWINSGFTKLTGYGLDEIKGSYGEMLRFDIKGYDYTESMIYKCFEHKKAYRYIAQNRSKDGRTYWAATSLTPIIENDSVSYVVGFDIDVTKFKLEENKKMNALMNSESDRNIQSELMISYFKSIDTPVMDVLELLNTLEKTHLTQQQQLISASLWQNMIELKSIVEEFNTLNDNSKKATNT